MENIWEPLGIFIKSNDDFKMEWIGTTMERLSRETEKIMVERFGKDNVITYGLSNKMRQISQNPSVAIAGDWFTAHGTRYEINFEAL